MSKGYLFPLEGTLAEGTTTWGLLYYRPTTHVRQVDIRGRYVLEILQDLRRAGLNVELADNDQISWGRAVLRADSLVAAL